MMLSMLLGMHYRLTALGCTPTVGVRTMIGDVSSVHYVTVTLALLSDVLRGAGCWVHGLRVVSYRRIALSRGVCRGALGVWGHVILDAAYPVGMSFQRSKSEGQLIKAALSESYTRLLFISEMNKGLKMYTPDSMPAQDN